MSFRLRNIPVLSRVGADRADDLRTDIDAAITGWSDAQLLRVDHRNQVLLAEGRVVLTAVVEYADSPPADAVFLGRLADGGQAEGTPGGGRHVWVVRAALEPPPGDSGETTTVVDPRRTSHPFDDVSAQLVASALALLNWHDSACFSPIDGTPTRPIRAGWARRNPLTGHEEFPRIDPAVICLVHDGADRAVLARQTVWPPRLFSLIAGFVEAGEAFETRVVRARSPRTRPDRHRRALPGQPTVAVPAFADGRFRGRCRPRRTVRLPRRGDRRGRLVHPR